jgi:hypothetical protein
MKDVVVGMKFVLDQLKERATYTGMAKRFGIAPAQVKKIAVTNGWTDKFKGTKRSKWEEEVAQYIESLGHRVERNRRDIIAPYEVDIWIPELRWAFECNGRAFHSEEGDTKKILLAVEQGINLVAIREEYWKKHNDIVRKSLKIALMK